MVKSNPENHSKRRLLPRRWRVGGYSFVLLLLAIVVLQNLEPTHLDILFWSLGDVPKLVLVLGSMFLGVLLWEMGRLLIGMSND